MNLKKYITSVPDFPKKGILFRDITSLLENDTAFKYCIDELIKNTEQFSFNKIAVIESRGFIFGSVLSYLLSKPLILIRKKDKLPGDKLSIKYDLEYNTEVLQIKKNSVTNNDKLLIVDDLIATGGSSLAVSKLIEQVEGTISGFLFVINLNNLNGNNLLINKGYKSLSLMEY
ncbi:MAG: adenine phosphoribosyltransferase [Pontiellaceae bacterium]